MAPTDCSEAMDWEETPVPMDCSESMDWEETPVPMDCSESMDWESTDDDLPDADDLMIWCCSSDDEIMSDAF
jgi:hypothetical protein